MKLIVAMIRPETLPAIQDALADARVRLSSVGEVSDLRRKEASVYRGSEYRTSRVRLRLEVAVDEDSAVDEVVEAILRGAGAIGGRGGEEIFVMNVDTYRATAPRSMAASSRG
jgi:nitrogen regulatory protein PII